MLKFKVIKRQLPGDQSAKPKFYISIKKVQTVDLDYIAKELKNFAKHVRKPVIALSQVTGVENEYERISLSFNLKHKLIIDENTTGHNLSYGNLNDTSQR